MAALSPARSTALSVLSERRRRDARIRELLRSRVDVAALAPQDRALCQRLAVGSVAASGMLAEIVASYVRRPRDLEPRVADALALATYELCFLSTPTPVAVSQGVELVRSIAPKAARLANAVLRRVAEGDAPKVRAARERVAAATRPDELSCSDLVRASALPQWLISSIISDRGVEVCRDLVLSLADPAPVFVAANAAHCSAASAEELLDAAGIPWTPSSLPGCVRVEDPARLAATDLLENVDLVVCDEGAQIACCVAAPVPGLTMLEVGQGRATKTVLLTSRARSRGGITAIVGVDSVAYKVDVARLRLTRAGVSEAICMHFDATQLDSPNLPDSLDRTFHQVFVDAPCSGTGTMRRHPETAWSLDPAAVDPNSNRSLVALQLSILAAAASRVEPGGTLTYSTCSLLAAEDERLVRRFLASEVGLSFSLVSAIEALAGTEASAVAAHMASDGTVLTTPQPGGCDGHFVARMVRTGESNS